MDPLDRAAAYLSIPWGYAEALGGLSWSLSRDAIERRDGTALVLAEELRPLLEGVCSQPPAPPFAFVLNLLHLMKVGGGITFERLHRAFVESRGAAARRNTGLLIAELCRDLPAAVGAVTGPNVIVAMQSLRLYGDHSLAGLAVDAPLPSDEFERRIAHRLSEFDDACLIHWFTHGCGPTGAGRQLAAAAESLAVRMARLLTLARQRTRLAGAATLVPALDAAFTIPPRRHSPDTVPQGGYCDVTTRGDPQRLLPAQFALDSDEFVRRFAGQELLYFKREEPHEAQRPERVIVLDQGVRTWGCVRLALAAAAFSLLSKDSKRSARIRLWLTSTTDPIDVLERELESVADLLEASDLTSHPGVCLWRALRSSDEEPGPRDVILLTHPRSLRDPSLLGVASGERRANDRLFALSVDDAGRAELAEWSVRGLATLRSFRVDLQLAETAQPETEPSHSRPRGVERPWTGDVEPIPFPFCPGIVTEPLALGFDADGEWLAIAGREGVLQGLPLDGSPAEVLPRPYRNGAVLKEVEAILGVTGGVVVCGRMIPGSEPVGMAAETFIVAPQPRETPVLASGTSELPLAVPVEQWVAAHYHRTTRRVTLHFFGPASGATSWSAFPELHCVAVRNSTAKSGCALDLTTLGRYPGSASSSLTSRARPAWERATLWGTPPHTLPLHPFPKETDVNGPFLYVMGTKVHVRSWRATDWEPWEPQRDGKPLLEGAIVHRAQLAGDVLALAVGRVGERKLVLLRGPDGAVLGEMAHPIRNLFALSRDGRLIARRDVTRAVVANETAGSARALATASHAGLHNALELRLTASPFRLVIAIGSFAHIFQLFEDRLRYSLAHGWDQYAEPKGATASVATTGYDPSRFPTTEVAAAGPWRAVLDRLGQALLFRQDGLLVATFVVRRERVAAWIPGGVFWGEPALIGGPPTPDAERKIGQAILAAGG